MYSPAPQFMSETHAAKRVGRTPSTLRRWCRDGSLTAYEQPYSRDRIYFTEHVDRVAATMRGRKGGRPPGAKNKRQRGNHA